MSTKNAIWFLGIRLFKVLLQIDHLFRSSIKFDGLEIKAQAVGPRQVDVVGARVPSDPAAWPFRTKCSAAF